MLTFDRDVIIKYQVTDPDFSDSRLFEKWSLTSEGPLVCMFNATYSLIIYGPNVEFE